MQHKIGEILFCGKASPKKHSLSNKPIDLQSGFSKPQTKLGHVGVPEYTCRRGIEWSLRAFASMRAVRLFLRAQAEINFLLRAESTLEITNGEQRALRKFSASWSQVIWLTLSKEDNRRKAMQHVKILSRFNHSQ